jgi:hypothetical protein
MTTHDQQAAAESATTIEPETSSARAEAPVTQSEPSPEPAQTETVPQSAEAQPSDDESLFAADPSGLRSRWDDIQAAFVDDPSGCVQKADGLVEEVIEQLTSRFADARSRLEGQWARGEQASTEDLRLALQRYREFFRRLLAV